MKHWMVLGGMLVAAVVLLPGMAMTAAPPTPDLLDRLVVLESTVQALHADYNSIVHRGDLDPIEAVFSGARPVQAPDDVHQRALAHP